jgi:hypothetical protein
MKHSKFVKIEELAHITVDWKYLELWQRKLILARFIGAQIRRLQRLLAMPAPVRLSLTTAFVMFGLLLFLPLHPMSLPISFGGGLSFALIFKRM